jgi:ADP-heptose:LPS heptosyltransferase
MCRATDGRLPLEHINVKNILIIKLNATGDVVRTTTLLHRLQGNITWITARNNMVLLENLAENLRCISWEERAVARDSEYDLVINLEDELEMAVFAKELGRQQMFGAYVDAQNKVCYTDDSRRWFDLSLISVYGREKADRLKLQNRRTYQELIFDGLGLNFKGEKYLLPKPTVTDLSGDVAIAPVAGPVWPMKNWAYYDQIKGELEARGLRVNMLPRRQTLLEHMGDVKNHRCLVGGDSLPMHLALGTGTSCVTIFNCTSPWEIYDYGIQTKIVSPLMDKFFYNRGFDASATTAIGLDEVLNAVMNKLSSRMCVSGKCS